MPGHGHRAYNLQLNETPSLLNLTTESCVGHSNISVSPATSAADLDISVGSNFNQYRPKCLDRRLRLKQNVHSNHFFGVLFGDRELHSSCLHPKELPSDFAHVTDQADPYLLVQHHLLHLHQYR